MEEYKVTRWSNKEQTLVWEIEHSPNIKLPEAVPYNVDLREHTEGKD